MMKRTVRRRIAALATVATVFGLSFGVAAAAWAVPSSDDPPGETVVENEASTQADATTTDESTETDAQSTQSESTETSPSTEQSTEGTSDSVSGQPVLLDVVVVDKVTFCHARPPQQWGWWGPKAITTSVNAFFNSGHSDHGADIVPPFDYQKGSDVIHFPGLNWTAEGQAILANDCQAPKPSQPEDQVTTENDSRSTCAAGVEGRSRTVTTAYVWNDEEGWVLGTPSYGEWSAWTHVRDLTSAEKVDLKCPQPNQPDPKVEKTDEHRSTCATGVESREGTITTAYVFDETTWSWVLGAPGETQWGAWTHVRDLTNAEKAELKCPQSEQPADLVTQETVQQKSCKAGVEERSRTTTTPYVFDVETWTWKLGTAQVGDWSAWTHVRDLTADERKTLQCDNPQKPDDVVQTVTEQHKTCAAGVEERSHQVVTTYTLVDGKWMGDTEAGPWSDWTKVRDLNADERRALKCDAAVAPPQPEGPALATTGAEFLVPGLLTAGAAMALGALTVFVRRRQTK